MISVNTNSIGVDISTSSVKVANIVRTGKKISIKNFYEEKIPVSALVAGVIRQPENVTLALERCIAGLKIKKGKKLYAVCTIPDDKTYMQEGAFPNLGYAKLKEAIQFKIQTFIPLPLTEVYWDFHIIEENADGTLRVIISAAAKETVDSYYAVVKNAGLVPVSFENSSMSVLRAIDGKRSKDSLLLDIGKTQTTISLAEKDTIKYSSTIHSGLNQLINAYDEYFNIDDDKSIQLIRENGFKLENEGLRNKVIEVLAPLKQELERTLNYQNKESIDGIYIFGEGITIKGLTELLKEDISIPFKEISLDITNTTNEDISRILPVIGAAYKHIVKDAKSTINFLPEQAERDITHNIIKDRIFSILRLLSMNMIGYVVIFVILTLFLITQTGYLNERVTTLKKEETTKQYDATGNTITQYNSLIQKVNVAESSQNEWIGFLTDNAAQVPSGIFLTSFSITPVKPSWTIQISGTAKSRDLLLTYAHNLEFNSKYLANVTLPISFIQQDGTITFSINATLAKLKL